MTLKKILLIISGSVVGGHEMQAYEIAADLISAGHDVTVLCSAQTTSKYFGSLGCKVAVINFSVPGKIWKQFLGASAVANVLQDHVEGYDKILLSAGTIEGLVALSHAIKKLPGSGRVVGYVPMYIDRSVSHGLVGKIYNVLLNHLGRAVDEYLTINKIQQAVIIKNLKKPTAVVTNKIRAVTAPREDFGRRLVYVGRFDDKQKGLLDLLTLLDDERNPFRELVLIGDGPDAQAIRLKAASTRWLHVSFAGWLSGAALESFLGSGDVLIMNSRWEGEPLVIREFAARGLMSVSKDITGVRGLVRKKFRFAEPGNLMELLNAVYQQRHGLTENYFKPVDERRRAAALAKFIG